MAAVRHVAMVKQAGKDDAVPFGIKYDAGERAGALSYDVARALGLDPATLLLYDVTGVKDAAILAEIKKPSMISQERAPQMGKLLDPFAALNTDTVLIAVGTQVARGRRTKHGTGRVSGPDSVPAGSSPPMVARSGLAIPKTSSGVATVSKSATNQRLHHRRVEEAADPAGHDGGVSLAAHQGQAWGTVARGLGFVDSMDLHDD